MATKSQLAEREEARERLLDWLKPGDTVHTILRHRSASGMLRVIDLVKLECKNGGVTVGSIGWNAAKAMGDRYDRDRDGIRVPGAGMDMGFDIVYNLSATLFPHGFDCPGDGCPSNDHSNGDRNYSPHHHRDGGYALRQRWL